MHPHTALMQATREIERAMGIDPDAPRTPAPVQAEPTGPDIFDLAREAADSVGVHWFTDSREVPDRVPYAFRDCNVDDEVVIDATGHIERTLREMCEDGAAQRGDDESMAWVGVVTKFADLYVVGEDGKPIPGARIMARYSVDVE